MSISGIQSGYQLIQLSQKMADDATHDIQQGTVKKSDLEFNNIELSIGSPPSHSISSPNDPSSSTEPLVNLMQSAGYNRIGASVVEKSNEMIGSLLDIHV
ncbi:hypothetical protein [Vibrio alfacsensis]|uniref:hypothetical protein n=1 Tax=Vibrio alfacsensis TaxID=1074311 RepID=UPI00406843FF